MSSKAFIIDNPVITLGPDPDDVPAGTAMTITCDLTRAEITNDTNMVDTGSLCGPAQLPGKITFTLELEGYQAWDVTQDLARYLWEHQRKEVPFTLVTKNEPVSATNPEFSGSCVCVPPEVGGTREAAAVFTCALPIIGTPVVDDVGTREALASSEAPTSPSSGSGNVPSSASTAA